MRSLWSDFQQVWNVATFVSILLSIIALGLQGWAIQWVKETLGPALTIGDVLSATAPLSLSVAILARGLWSGWFKNPVHFLAVAVLVLGLAAWIAGSWGHPTGSAQVWEEIRRLWEKIIKPDPNHPSTNLVSYLLKAFGGMLEIYWDLYGPEKFFSSLAVGAFLAWLWGFMEDKRPA